MFKACFECGRQGELIEGEHMKNKASWEKAAMMMTAVLIIGLCGMEPGIVRADDEQDTVVIIQQKEGESLPSLEAAEEVVCMNRITESNALSGVVDINNMTQISAEEVRALIDGFFIPDTCIYLDGTERQEGDLDAIIARRNLSMLADPVELQYGVLIKNTAARMYPTWQKLSDETGENAADYFQETMFAVGEGVVILHQTEDKIWSFVQAANDTGWVETKNIAFCMREQMMSFSDPQSFLVVTEDYVAVGNDELRMGTRLPLSRLEEGYAVAWIPQATESGSLYQVEQSFNLSGGVHIGYLPFDVQTVVQQAYKLQNAAYGKGDANGYLDEGSALTSIFKCFGIMLPRKISRMVYAGAQITDMSQMSVSEKKNLIDAQSPGCLLLTQDNGALYLGNQSGTAQIFHSIDRYSTDGATLTDVFHCLITPLDIFGESGRSFLEELLYLVVFCY